MRFFKRKPHPLSQEVARLSARVKHLEEEMAATIDDVNTAIDAFNTELASARNDILNEIATLKNGPDLQPVVDKVNAATASVQDLVKAVVPAPAV